MMREFAKAAMNWEGSVMEFPMGHIIGPSMSILKRDYVFSDANPDG
jgi:hypothetical protein